MTTRLKGSSVQENPKALGRAAWIETPRPTNTGHQPLIYEEGAMQGTLSSVTGVSRYDVAGCAPHTGAPCAMPSRARRLTSRGRGVSL